jgi:hypothetical protein
MSDVKGADNEQQEPMLVDVVQLADHPEMSLVAGLQRP